MKSVKNVAKKASLTNTIIKNSESWYDTSTGISMINTLGVTVSFKTCYNKQDFVFTNSKKETAKKVLDSMQNLLKEAYKDSK